MGNGSSKLSSVGQVSPKNRSSRRDNARSSTRKKASTDESSSKPATTSKLKIIDGRGFNDGELANPKYMLPNDDDECDRLTIQHYALRNYRAPMHDLLESGIKEMATEYPNSEFVGTDVAFSFPSHIHPVNTSFCIADTTQLPFPDNHFDYVFQRMATFAFSEEDWETAIQELMRVTKPGGFIELVFNTLAARNINGRVALQLSGRLAEHGILDVSTSEIPLPIGWGGKVGELTSQVVTAAIQATKPVLSQTMAISTEEYNAMAKDAEQEFEQYKSYHNVWYVYGRKPRKP
ncbi:hypothetical protein BC938DRAFT_478295 [Jimgerdemannia flammicorona]|uniref:Methyltransferase domain-containing protein n=1 Tax=Jimgerdemannia flammicorona TaxID=994334 RepID=A0A433QN38_9FUNG|nr:hypothetical protein BC938DRAFT_478295 [Jimgerdemannia flammicorona]